MSDLPFYQEQLQFMIDLAGARPEWLDPFFRFLNYFDSPYFYFVLIPTVWLGFSYQWGLRVYYWFSLNSVIIHLVKASVGWNRPSTDFPEIGLFHPSSYGFPSGGAQGALFLAGLLIYCWRTRSAWAIGILYCLLISFSRLYLGVHYPIDILGGWALGGLVLTLFITTHRPLEHWLAKKGLKFSLLLSLAIPLALTIAFPLKDVRYIAGSLIGVGIGTYISLKHHLFLPKPKTLIEAIGRAFLGVALLFALVFLLPGGHTFFPALIVGLFMSLAASPICRWFIKTTTS